MICVFASVTGQGRTEGNFAMDKGEGRTETVLGGTEEMEHDMDWKTSLVRRT